jgi:hypothetical protein
VVDQAPVRWAGRELGKALTLRDHTVLQTLTSELDPVRGLTDALLVSNWWATCSTTSSARPPGCQSSDGVGFSNWVRTRRPRRRSRHPGLQVSDSSSGLNQGLPRTPSPAAGRPSPTSRSSVTASGWPRAAWPPGQQPRRDGYFVPDMHDLDVFRLPPPPRRYGRALGPRHHGSASSCSHKGSSITCSSCSPSQH